MQDQRTSVYRCWIVLAVWFVAAAACWADSTRDLQLAARSGDLDEVRRLVEAGVPVDASDAWGTTPLALAAQQGQVAVVRYLLEKGADPSSGETFFGASVLDLALWKGEPDYTIAKILLAAGAADRVTALVQGFSDGDVELARAAMKSGPLTESEAADLRAHFEGLEGELREILEAVKTRPDPAPPTYTTEQLADFAGRFEDGEGNAVEVKLVEGTRLEFERAGERSPLTAKEDRVFHNPDAGITVHYYGRAGTIEGIRVELPGQEAMRMRVAESPIVGVTDLPEFAADPNARPTVHWPGFRGANRGGIGDGLDTPIEFDLATGEGVAWQAELPGLGNSSPIVWGNRVYVTTAVAKGGSTPLRTGLTGAGDEVEENVEHRWLVLAFDKANGKKVWETEVGRGVPLTKRHFKATQANSSPVTDGEHVVVVFPTAGLACLDTDGKLQWKHELGGLNAGGFNDPGLQWGFAASPVIYKDKVILQVDIHDGAYLAAWDLKTGKPLWKTERPDVAPSWATPAIWPTAQGDELVVNASIIRGYDPTTGRELWSLEPTSIQVVASPVVGSKHVFVSSGYPPARPIYAVEPGIRGQHFIESDEDAKAVLAWRHTRGGAYMPTPLLYRGLLYVVHHNARIVAHDARSGAKVYQARFSAGGTCTASPVVANGKIYQGTEEGTLYVFEAGPEYHELAVPEFGEPLMATPAISEGLVFVRTPSRLVALGNVGESDTRRAQGRTDWVAEADIAALRSALDAGELSTEALVRDQLDRIARLDDDGPRLNAVLALDPEALAVARERDSEMREGKVRGPLHGIPVLLKGNIDVTGLANTAGSLALEGNIAAADAFLVARLREAGAVVLGTANLSEWANFRSTRSSSGWSSIGRQTRNPYVLDRNPCGSSSGSAVAVAAGLTVVAIGTETDGSVVCPAGQNGVVGIKPTIGLVSRAGIIPIAHSQDTAGPMARTVRDAALVLEAIAASDPADPASAEFPDERPYYTTALKENPRLDGVRLGVWRGYYGAGNDPDVEACLDGAIAVFEALGAEVVDPADLGDQKGLDSAENTVLYTEFKPDLEAYLQAHGAPDGMATLKHIMAFNEKQADVVMPYFGQEVFQRALEQAGTDSPEYRSALAESKRISRGAIDGGLSKHGLNAIIAPTNSPAWPTDLANGDHFLVSSSQPAAVAGYPNVTVPMCFVHELPVGLSIFGTAYSEAELIRIAHGFEQETRVRQAPRFLPTLELP